MWGFEGKEGKEGGRERRERERQRDGDRKRETGDRDRERAGETLRETETIQVKLSILLFVRPAQVPGNFEAHPHFDLLGDPLWQHWPHYLAQVWGIFTLAVSQEERRCYGSWQRASCGGHTGRDGCPFWQGRGHVQLSLRTVRMNKDPRS